MDSAAQVTGLVQGEVAVWRDAGCICLKTVNRYNDPVELSDEDAIHLAETLLRLAGQPR